MKKLFLTIGLILGATQAHALTGPFVQITTNTLQPNTTNGFNVSSGTVRDFNPYNLKSTGTWTLARTTFNFINAVTSGTVIDISTTTGTGTLSLSSGSFTSFFSAKGVTNGSDAGVGVVGEYISSTTANGGSNQSFPTSGGIFATVSTLTFTSAGDWDVSGCVNTTANGATVNTVQVAISTFTGNTTTDQQVGYNQMQTLGPVNGVTGAYVCIPPTRFNVLSAINIYLKVAGTFSIATPQVSGATIHARRAR